ncbi:MAG: bifunctional glutamate N-acetyltransferase/amino-acid acetyltransferase ArgJ [Oscillospiraceae bacterium]|nr:bifunctional glutamate N-acetyltransferase/amino-acid acetyltransferase ArgJ [Oscillospiraceae bacterium]
MEIHKIPGGVTAAKGFSAASCAAGIKYQGRTDMAMLFCDVPCRVSGTFTSNVVKAAPVKWDMQVVKGGKGAQAVVVNSGIANAGTGKEGMTLCEKTAKAVGALLGIPAEYVLIGSTGVIGPNIELGKLVSGAEKLKAALSSSLEAGTDASRAIMTTDTVNKEFAYEFPLPDGNGGSVKAHIGGMSKGSGMIHPNMCTMLAYLTTDAAISQQMLDKAVHTVIPDTFNMISVDGDTSTNDTFLLLADGLAGNREIACEDESYALFLSALFAICRDLAMKMAADGEGATKLIETHVFGADTKENARILARSVVSSSLVKAMIFGKDANCGRVLCALGYAGVSFDPDLIRIDLIGKNEQVCFYKDAHVQEFDEEKALRILNEDAIHFSVDMAMGESEATAWGCDLTYDYVRINGDYRS